MRAKDVVTKCLVYEPNGSGHRFWYARMILEALCAENSSQVELVTTANACTLAEFAENIEPLTNGNSRVEIWKFPVPISSSTRLIVDSLRIGLALRTSLVVILDADRLVLPLLITATSKSRKNLRLLVLRSPNNSVGGRIKGFAIRQISRDARVGILADPLGEIDAQFLAKTHLRAVADNVILVPDPAESHPDRALTIEIKGQLRNLSSHLKWGIVAGVVDDRKCVRSILEALDQSSFGLVLAGKIDPSLRPAIQAAQLNHQDRLLVANTYLPESSLDSYIAASDFTFSILSTETGSSGILAKSLRLGHPCIAGGNRMITDLVERNGCGVKSLDRSSESIATAIDALIAEFPHYVRGAVSTSRRLAGRQDFVAAVLGV